MQNVKCKIKNIKLTIEYDGTNYSGWQIQKNSERSIQKILLECIFKITGEKVKLISSGRTDRGVHALRQVANFKTESRMDGSIWKNALTASLPRDIRVIESEEVEPDFHSRYDAKSRIYSYIILNQESPSVFLRNYVYHIFFPLDLEDMKRASLTLLGEHDFSSFRASSCGANRPVRRIIDLSVDRAKMALIPWIPVCRGEVMSFITITIEANAFLHHMARNIVGTLIEVGKGRFSPERMEEILKAKDRTQAGPTAPPHGLFLVRVKY
jgi:tRNA pseudouridine38-40 synthase